MLRLAAPQNFGLHPVGMYREDPVVGYVLTPDFEGHFKRSEFHTPFVIGDSGLRGNKHRPKTPNTFRILVLGDSQAFGFGVTDDATFVSRLEALLTRRYPETDIQVLNGGVPGYGTADELAFFIKRGPELHPDLVVVQFLSVNDLQENRAPAATWAGVRDGILTARNSEQTPSPPAWAQAQRWLKLNSHLARLLLDSVGYLLTRVGLLGGVDALWGEDFTDDDAERGVALLREIAQRARQLGAPTLFLYTTGQAHVIEEEYEPLRSRTVIEDAAQLEGCSWIDATAELRKRSDRMDLYYPKDGHWTAAGHQAIAEILEAKISEKEWISESLGRRHPVTVEGEPGSENL